MQQKKKKTHTRQTVRDNEIFKSLDIRQKKKKRTVIAEWDSQNSEDDPPSLPSSDYSFKL